VVFERVGRVVGGADDGDLEVVENGMRAERGFGQLGVGGVPDRLGGIGREDLVDAEVAAQFEMGPVEQGIAQRVRDGVGPGEKLLFRIAVAGDQFFGHAVGTHGAPLVMVGAEPEIGDGLPALVVGDFLRRQVAVVVDDRQSGGNLVVEGLPGLGVQQEMLVEIGSAHARGFRTKGQASKALHAQMICLAKSAGPNVLSCSMESVQQRVGENEWQLRVELAAAYRVFAMLGWTHLIHTHITVEAGENQFLINPFGLLWNEVTASNLIKVNAAGEILDPGSTGYGINPAGFKIHAAIHTSERSAKWVMHIHVPEVVAVSNLQQGLIRGLSTYAMDLGPISYHGYEHATAEESDVCDRMLRDFGSTNNVLLLRNHGSITVGDSVHQAFFLTYQLVEACRVQLMTLSMARSEEDVSVVPEQIVAETYEIVQAKYTGEDFGKLEWQAARRKMEARLASPFAV